MLLVLQFEPAGFAGEGIAVMVLGPPRNKYDRGTYPAQPNLYNGIHADPLNSPKLVSFALYEMLSSLGRGGGLQRK